MSTTLVPFNCNADTTGVPARCAGFCNALNALYVAAPSNPVPVGYCVAINAVANKFLHCLQSANADADTVAFFRSGIPAVFADVGCTVVWLAE